MTSPKGFPIEGRREDLDTNTVKLEPKHTTVPPIGTNRRALDVMASSFYRHTTAAVVEALSTDSIVILTGHSVKVGDLVRVLTTANSIAESEMFVNRVIDANSFELAGVVSALFAAGDTIDILRAVAPRVDQTGASLASVISPAIKINRGPGGVYVETTIVKDTTTSANTVPMPVELVGFDGGQINITANDIGVQLSHNAANPDSTRIGNGTNEWGINGSNEGLVHDTDALAQLVLILAKMLAAPSTEAKQDTVITAHADLLIELKLKADLTETQPVSIAAQPLPAGAATEATLASLLAKVIAAPATEAKQDTLIAKDFSTETTLAALLAKVIAAPATEAKQDTMIAKDFATETTLAAQSAKLPAALGPQASAASLSIVPANNVVFKTGTDDVVSTKYLDFSSSNVTGAAYTELIADTGGTAGKKLTIFMAAGDPMHLAIGAAASEVDKLIIPAGGFPHSIIDVVIPANSRISLKRVVAGTTNAGTLITNIMG